MTEKTSDERRASEKDELKINKETVKDLEPTETDEAEGVKGGARVWCSYGAGKDPGSC